MIIYLEGIKRWISNSPLNRDPTNPWIWKIIMKVYLHVLYHTIYTNLKFKSFLLNSSYQMQPKCISIIPSDGLLEDSLKLRNIACSCWCLLCLDKCILLSKSLDCMFYYIRNNLTSSCFVFTGFTCDAA